MAACTCSSYSGSRTVRSSLQLSSGTPLIGFPMARSIKSMWDANPFLLSCRVRSHYTAIAPRPPLDCCQAPLRPLHEGHSKKARQQHSASLVDSIRAGAAVGPQLLSRIFNLPYMCSGVDFESLSDDEIRQSKDLYPFHFMQGQTLGMGNSPSRVTRLQDALQMC